jgi:transcriptional regulator with XRE-family HTH domain
MPRFSADTLIKSLRKAKGLTQHELCEGICSQDELSRIERNKHRPTWYVFERIMQKLGEDPNRY